jgi:N-acetylglucosaminyl-diphospho-decaprenol L-rhamnosyltransferase
MSEDSIGVAIVSYDAERMLGRCLKSVLAYTSSPVLVVDNASTDGSPQLVSREFPGVDLVVEAENRGYGAAANVAIHRLGTPYVLLLNADTELTPGAAAALAEYLDRHPRAAVAGPRLTRREGAYEPSAHRFPTPRSLLVQESGLTRVLGLGRREWQAGPVDWVLGAALAIRRDAFVAVGGFDEEYFLYQEEVDLCHRLHEAGWEIHYAPVATVVHVGGGSTGERESELFAQFVRSTRHFARVRLSRSSEAGVRAVLGAVLLARIVRDAVRLTWSHDRDARRRRRRRLGVWLSGLAALKNAGGAPRSRSEGPR